MTAIRPLAAAALLLALAACGSLRKVQEPSLAQRCGDAMQAAFPGGEIEVTGQHPVARAMPSLATAIVAVEGRRGKLPANSALPHDVAVECRFDDGILTSFRWTKGPLR